MTPYCQQLTAASLASQILGKTVHSVISVMKERVEYYFVSQNILYRHQNVLNGLAFAK